jgi:type VI secretion system secreted protein VgrG
MAFELVSKEVAPRELDLVHFSGSEALSEPFRYSVRLATHVPFETLERQLFARPAALLVDERHDDARAITGIVRTLETAGTVLAPEGPCTAITLELVPRLALLEERQRSRIFQNLETAEILQQILEEWRIPYRFAIEDRHGAWPYCVQHDESDLAFVSRILAADGLTYYFEFPSAAATKADPDEAREVMVVTDSARDTAGKDPLHLPIAAPSAIQGAEESIASFSRRRTLAPSSLRVRGHNPENARYDAQGHHSVAAHGEDPERLAIYQFLPDRPAGAEDEPAVTRTLQQLRRRARTAQGESNARRLRAGASFVVSDGDAPVTYVVTRATSTGRAAWYEAGDAPVYRCLFEAVPASSSIAPPLPARRRHAGFDSAVVVGPPGAETHTDGSGRVKVQFRWDLDRPADAQSSCWMRVAQGWAGSGFGVHFLPRVGMEVLVGYVDGDINRPVVVGCLHNSSNPPAVRLPVDHAKSGISTRGTPGGVAGNEFTFDDTRAKEKIALKAERDLQVTAQRNRAVAIGRDDATTIGRDATSTIAGDRAASVAQNDRLEVGAMQWIGVTGDRVLRVAGEAIEQLTGGRVVDVGGHSRTFVAGDRQEGVSGRTDTLLEGDAVTQHHGCVATVVGTADHKRSWLLHVEGASSSEATGVLRIASSTNIVLSCGETELTLTPEAIHLKASTILLAGGAVKATGDSFAAVTEKKAKLSSKKVQLFSSDGASVRLAGDAKIDGSKVKLNGGSESDDAEDKVATSTPTTIKLRDQDQKPIPNERYVLVASDGTRTTGLLDKNGEATILGLTGEVEVLFPELGDWSAMPTGDANGHAIAPASLHTEAVDSNGEILAAPEPVRPGQDGHP